MAAYFSEISITGDSPQEFLEIAVTQGTDTSGYSIVHYVGNGQVYLTYSLGTVESTTNGFDVYTVDDSDPDFPVTTGEGNETGNIWPDDAFALVDNNGNVIQFVSFYDNNITATEGPANGMTSDMIGTPGFGQSLQSDDGGNSYYKQSSPNRNSIPCFEASTQILTATGYRRADALCLGDLVKTVDNGYQQIRWIREYHADLSGAALSQKPVCIRADALGRNRPFHDLCVSPQHRVVIGHPVQMPQAGRSPMLAPAKGLAGLPGIFHMPNVQIIRYVHFACARHEVICANGAELEALYLSDTVVAGLPRRQRDGLRKYAKRHQDLRTRRRPFLRVAEARRLSKAGDVALV